ncbi:MAG: hypothetical protein U9P10_12335 [Thermodesulfobacteriota bacterium]|nr:hypothetical protein [Thermodesulfobacteriota bacterium]
MEPYKAISEKLNRRIKKILPPVMAGILIFFWALSNSSAETIIIVPFHINSQNDITYIRDGVHNMLLSRLSWKNHVITVERNSASSVLTHLDPSRTTGSAENTLIPENTDYVLTGSITEFAGAYSIDTRVYNCKTSESVCFYNQMETTRDIIPGTSSLAAEINNTVFNRSTLTTQFKEKKNSPVENQVFTQNPEALMAGHFEKKEKKPFWKFWKNDSIEEEDQETDEETPFWKFWGDDSEEEDETEEQPPYTNSSDEKTNKTSSEKKKKPFWKIW